MRKLLGGVVLAAGVGGLGWYGSGNQAERMQAEVTTRAQTVAGTAIHAIETSVSGRDITASGIVQDQAEFDSLQAALEDVQGRRVVNMDAVGILPVADPFAVAATRTQSGDATLTGAIPSEAARADLAVVAGDLAAGLDLSTGSPDDEWTSVAAQAYTAIGTLKTGEMTLSGRDLTITGLAANPRDLDAVLASLADLPEGYTLADMIEVEDDGTPLRLTLTNDDAGATATGKFPSGMAASLVSDRYDGVDTSDIVEATIAGVDGWPAVAVTGMDALDELVGGELTIIDTDVTLTGSASPDGRAHAEALMAALPAGFTGSTDISIYDDGTPFMMTMDYDGAAATATGKYPADFTVAAPDGATLTQTGEAAFIGDDTGAFATNAAAGVAALGLLEQGSLQVTVDKIILTGIASTPDVDAAIEDALSAASGVEVEQTFTYLDDGTPADWSVSYDAAIGGAVAGKLPSDLTADLVAGAMGLSKIDGDPTVALGAADGPSDVSFLTLASEYLPETEKLSFATNGEQSTLDMVLSPGVDADLVAADLAARLPGDIAFSVTPLGDLPETGAIRTNQATLNRERFQFGNWLPILTFAPVATICTDQTTRALETNGVNFLSSSARLDAKSIRAINTLTAIAQRCVDEGGLTLEVGGHTDDTGSEISNQILSENRANSVRNALIARGIPETAMTATGFGQSRPLASNETEEGRATNRRTEIIWSE